MDAKRKVHAASGGGDSVPAPQPAPAKERSTKRRKVSVSWQFFFSRPHAMMAMIAQREGARSVDDDVNGL
jgi:hypothetical protein